MRSFIVILMMISALLSAPRHEYCIVSAVEVCDAETDVVYIVDADGDEYGYYADTQSVVVGDVVNVTFVGDRIVVAEK